MSIKLLVYDREGKQIDITNLVTTVTWSGDYKSASRKLEFDILTNSYDSKIPVVAMGEGYLVVFYEDDKEIFRGFIYSVSKETNKDISYVAYDHGQKLIDIKVAYNFKDISPNTLANKILNDYELSIGDIANSNTTYSKIFIDVSIYDAIMSAYTHESSSNSKKKYMILAKEGKINVIHKGEITLELELKEGENIISSSYSSSIANMVNKVIVVDEDGNSLSETINQEDLELYGLFQKILKIDDGENVETEANKLLNKREQSASLTGFGNTTCITGYAVTVLDNNTGLKGLFYIDTDKHTWVNGEYTINLNINFENIMNEANSGTDEKEEIETDTTTTTIDCEGNENFILPIAGAKVSSPYGMRVHPVTKVYKLHTGADLSASSGTSIKAMASGTVTEVTYNHTAWGNRVAITHTGNKYSTMYAHMSSVTVKKGQSIKQGQEVGKVGSTGYSTGPHLHFEVWKDCKESSTVDPISIIGKQAVQCNHATHDVSSSATTGGTKYKAQFTAYAAGVGCGNVTASGKTADYTKKMCAAPSNFAFGTKFTISGTGSSIDNQVYTVEDRGGAIKQLADGTYIIDILMANKQECLNFGRRNGYITVGGSSSSSSSSGTSTQQKIVSVAKAQLGIPYLWGGTTTKGFDCSGFVQYVFKQVGISIGRTTWEQYKGGKSVSTSNLQIGDVIITNNQNHVVLFIGENTIIHAPRTGTVIRTETYSSYWKGVTVGVRRYI